jgi:hypothetical protein
MPTSVNQIGSEPPAPPPNLNDVIWPHSNLPLRVAGLVAGIPILFLSQELDSQARMVFLTLLFYLGPYLFIGFAPAQWGFMQVGFAAGYAFSMSLALIIYVVLRSFGLPTSVAPFNAYKMGVLLNFVLFVIAASTWKRSRNRLDQSGTFQMLALGLFYPCFAFILVALLGSACLR